MIAINHAQVTRCYTSWWFQRNDQRWRCCIHSDTKACLCLQLLCLARDYAICFQSTLRSFWLKLNASHAVSEILWTLIQEKLNPQTVYNCNFIRRVPAMHAWDEFAGFLKGVSLQLEFSKQRFSFLDKNKKLISSDFWSGYS